MLAVLRMVVLVEVVLVGGRVGGWLPDWLYNCLACYLAVVVVVVTDNDDCIIIPSTNIHHFTSLTLRLHVLSPTTHIVCTHRL